MNNVMIDTIKDIIPILASIIGIISWCIAFFKFILKPGKAYFDRVRQNRMFLEDNYPYANETLRKYCLRIKATDNPGEEASIASNNNYALVERLIDSLVHNNHIIKYYLILGDVGTGKTTTLLKVVADYIKKPFVKNRKRIILLSLASSNCFTTISNLENPSSTILLLDSMDENIEAMKNPNAFFKSLCEKTEAFSSVIIASRTTLFDSQTQEPDYAPVIRKDTNDKKERVKKIYVLDLSEEDITEYLKKRFPLNRAKRKRAQRLINSVQSLAYKPIILDWICEFCSDVNDTIEGYLELYKAIINKWIEREAEPLMLDTSMQVMEELYENRFYMFCINVAKHMFKNLTNTIDKEQINEIAHTNGINISSITAKSRTILVRNSAGIYRFYHQSLYEFFIAQAWCYYYENWMIYAWNYYTDVNIERFIGEEKAYSFLKSGRSTAGSDMRFAYFHRRNLCDVDFSGMDLENADFSEADLTKANFSYSNLKQANFRGTKLNKATLSFANARNADFSGANLEDTDLHNTFLKNSRLTNSNYEKARNINYNDLINRVEKRDIILFGKYRFREDLDKEPIVWCVESIEDKKVLIVCEYRIWAFRLGEYGLTEDDYKEWASTVFQKEAFSDKEKEDMYCEAGKPLVFLKHYTKEEAELLFHNPYPGESTRFAIWLKR